MTRNTRALEVGQQALPLVLATLGVLEFGAVLFTDVRTMAADGVVAAVGPGALVPVTLAVVFATLLRASRDTLSTKAVTAVAAALFALGRVALVVALVASGADLDVGHLMTVVSGTVLGLSLAAWAGIEFRAAQLTVREFARQRRARPEPPAAGPPASPTPSPEPLAGAPRPGSPRSSATPTTVIRPVAPSPVRPPTSSATPAAHLWHRGSTPWPRRNEEDPDGTLIRPPRRR